ncbi:hypothetical protein JXJ21_20545 [candidate division KSB1 bacterium]|nr:hypothetical protein [candidate division KSB1 bacterium]
MTAEKLFFNAAAENDISLAFILGRATRSFENSLTVVDLRKPPFPQSEVDPEFACLQDCISRPTSVSSMIVQGVCPGEAPEFTTIWTILGYPAFSVALPTWVKSGEKLPRILTAAPGKSAALCDKALALKKRCFPITRGSGYKYINRAVLLNDEKNGILQKIFQIEAIILNHTQKILEDWRGKRLEKHEITDLYEWLDRTITAEFERNFGL